ncbi:MAG: enoyl-CoA hydratase-related protein [Dehalococcoidales bacterium]|nr:enoyl-CoA hydratase-related protein [Dehalococcoidales bacterium]
MACVNYSKANRIALITLNRPESLNAINAQLTAEFQAALVNFRDDPDVWVGILTGAGERSFSAGADIKESISLAGVKTSNGVKGVGPVRIDQIWKPVIAAINGYCLGGGLELALTCDLRIAAEHARFGTPEVQIGTIPAGGAIDRLPRFINRVKAAEMMLLGQQIDAREALEMGLVNKVVPQSELMIEAMRWAELMAKAAPVAVRAVKEGIIKGYDLPLEEALRYEHKLLDHIRETADFVEGARAFKDKRKPEWQAK